MKLTNRKKSVNIILTLLILSILSIVNPKILITNDIAKIDSENEYDLTEVEGLNNLNQQNLILNNLPIEPAQQDTDVIFEDLSIVSIINETTKLIEKVNITLNLNVTKYMTLIILEFKIEIDGIRVFEDTEQYYNPIQGLHPYFYVIEGWKLYESYAQGTANVTVSQLGPKTSISNVFSFNYIEYSPPPVIKFLGTEIIVPYINHTAIYNSNFGTENSTFIDCECVDYFEYRFEIEVLIPGNISLGGFLELTPSFKAIYLLQINRNKFYPIGNHNLSYFIDTTQLYEEREFDFVESRSSLSTRWFQSDLNISSIWTEYRIPKPDISYMFHPREFSRMAFQIFESDVSIEYIDTNQNSSIDMIKLNIQVYVTEDIEVYHVGYFVQRYLNYGYSNYYNIQREFHKFGYTNYTKGWNSFDVSLSTESLTSANLEGWQDGYAPVFFALSASWNQNITVNSEIIETNYWLSSYPHEIDIEMFPELQSLITSDFTSDSIDSSTTKSATTETQNKSQEETKSFSVGLIFFTPLWLVSMIFIRKKSVNR